MLQNSYFKLGLLFLFLNIVSCTSFYDKEPNFIKLNVPNLITIEEQTSYHVGDHLYINVDFSRYLPEDGYNELLDVYKTTKSEKFHFDFSFQKKNAYGNWSVIDVQNATIIYKGIKENYGYASVLNMQNNKYELRLSIPLLETGTYKIVISKEIYPYFNDKGVNLYIFTSVNGSNVVNDGYMSNYEFIVE